jgi:hypothetical protein
MANPIKETPEKMAEMRRNYEIYLESLERGRRLKEAGELCRFDLFGNRQAGIKRTHSAFRLYNNV